jgi:D-glycero-alpha-D-manno-heptose 1-phosphate guanylyltransferase
VEIKEAIILAGGLGTRLRDTLPDLPKSMAPVAGRPFLFYVINHLRKEGIERFIFSLGYKHEYIEKWLETEFATLNYTTVIEEQPLGTGGAIKLAVQQVKNENVLVANGDTLFRIKLDELEVIHVSNQAACTLALKPMKDFDRYGVVEINEQNRVISFREKKFYEKGLINGGIYLVNVPSVLNKKLPGKFSFEKDYLESLSSSESFFGSVQDHYFIDIGIPSDYYKADTDLDKKKLDLSSVDKEWTLFIDRDGIINYEKQNDYIRTWEEFRFYEEIPALFAKLARLFPRIIVVSNQRGVGRGLMTESALIDIHLQMKLQIESQGGRIDAIYYCTSPDPSHPDRKPNPGMAYRAARDFPGIDLQKSIMVGNKPSDMLFGKNAGMFTVFIASTHPESAFPHHDIDLRFENMGGFVDALSI